MTAGGAAAAAAAAAAEAQSSPLRGPVLVALLVVLAFYLLSRRFQATGCPFAGGSAAKAPGGAATTKMAAAGDLRLTLEQLREFDGRDASKPVYIAVRGKVYDVTPGRAFYGPGGPYAVFAGNECARALAFMKVTPEDCNDDLEGATEAQLKTLADWEAKFAQKYGVVGAVVAA